MIDHPFAYKLTSAGGISICTCNQPLESHRRDIMADIDDVDGHMTRGTVHTTAPLRTPTETIAEEAARIVYGERERTYDDPSRNFKKLAHMWTGTLLELLKPGAAITPQLVALCLIQLKISRESFKPTRENRVDGIGYWLCEDRVVAEEGKNDVV